MPVIARRISGATNNLGAPAGWDAERNGDCGGLWIRVIGDPGNGKGFVESAWEITPDDLAKLQEGRSLIVRIYGWQPPIALYVDPKAPDTKGGE